MPAEDHTRKPDVVVAANSSVTANGQFWKPPFPRAVSSLHMAPERTVSNASGGTNDDENEEDAEPTKNIYDTLGHKLLKFFFATFMFLLVIIGVCVNKETLVFFSKRNITDPTVYSYLIMIMLAPLFPVFLMDIALRWVREKEKTWKAKQKVEKFVVRPAAVIIASVLEGLGEVAGLIIWIIFVLPNVNRTVAIFLMNGLGVIPVLSVISMEWKARLFPPSEEEKQRMRQHLGWDNDDDIPLDLFEPATAPARIFVGLLRMVLLGMQVGGIAIFAYSTGLYWQIPVASVLTSLQYWRNFVLNARLPRHWGKAYERNRYTISAVKSVVKIIVIILFAIIYGVYGLGLTVGQVFSGWYTYSPYTIPFVLVVCTGFATYLSVWVSCDACLQRVGLALPMFLATPLAIVWTQIQCMFPVLSPLPYIGRCDLVGFDGILNSEFGPGYLTIIAGGLLWLSVSILVVNLWFGIPPNDALMIEKDLWSQPEFSVAFIEQCCVLNRSRDLKNENTFDSRKHWTFITTTMYRESAEEMKNLVMSLFRIDLDTPAKSRTYENWEAHVIFDNAMRKGSPEGLRHTEFNEYANQLLDILEEELSLPKVVKTETWYGYLIETKFAGGMALNVHMKDTTKVKQKKRWSQILYTHLLLEKIRVNPDVLRRSSCYVLMIDGDTQFSKKSVDIMRDIMEQDPDRIGAVSGRVLPLPGADGSNPLVWFQKFEYAAGFWFQKTGEHVLGTVLCSPGCFSLVRFPALYSLAGSSGMVHPGCAIEIYATECESAMDTLMFDQGEDRMLSTLLIKNGWMLQYSATALATTFCPEAFRDFFIQRRRWITSTLANLYHLIGSSVEISANNRSVSILFMVYTFTVLLSSIMSPATTILGMIGGLTYGFNGANPGIFIGIGMGIPALYIILCYFYNLDMMKDSADQKKKKTDIQISTAYLLCGLYALLVAVEFVGLAVQIVQQPAGPASVYIIALAAMFIIAAIVHGEFFQLIYGIVFLFFLPTMYLILIIYSMANIHDQSWGTRENSSPGAEKKDSIYSCKKLFKTITSCLAVCGFDTGFRDVEKAELKKEEPPKKPEEKKPEVKEDKKEVEMIILEKPKDEAKPRKPEPPKERDEAAKDAPPKSPSEPKKHVAFGGVQEPTADKKDADKKPKGILKKQSFYFPREILEQKVEEMSKLSVESDDWHKKNAKEMKRLSNRLRGYTIPVKKAADEKERVERIQQLADLQKSSVFVLIIVSLAWLSLVLVLSLNTGLAVLGSNVVGLAFLILSTTIVVIQFVAMIFHRVETLLQTIAYIPMTISCNMIIKTENERKAKLLPAKKMSQILSEQLAEGESAFQRVGRAVLGLPQRKRSTFQRGKSATSFRPAFSRNGAATNTTTTTTLPK